MSIYIYVHTLWVIFKRLDKTLIIVTSTIEKEKNGGGGKEREKDKK